MQSVQNYDEWIIGNEIDHNLQTSYGLVFSIKKKLTKVTSDPHWASVVDYGIKTLSLRGDPLPVVGLIMGWLNHNTNLK